MTLPRYWKSSSLCKCLLSNMISQSSAKHAIFLFCFFFCFFFSLVSNPDFSIQVFKTLVFKPFKAANTGFSVVVDIWLFRFSTAVSTSLSRSMRLNVIDWLKTSQKCSIYPSLCSTFVSSGCPFLPLLEHVLTIFLVRSCKILYIARALFEVASSACWRFSLSSIFCHFSNFFL